MAARNAVGNTLTGSTGSGNFVGATSPTLVTPALGTPTSGTLTNCTGLPPTGITAGTNGQFLATRSGAVSWKGGFTGFYAYANTTQALTGLAANKITLDTEVFDSGSLFDNATNYRYTPNIAGLYYICYNIVISSPTSGMYMIGQIYKNGSGVCYSRINNGTDTTFLTLYGGAVISMNGTTDYLELYCNPSVSKNILNGQVFTYMTGSLIEAS